MEFDTEYEVKYPQRSSFDSDKIPYFESEKTRRDAWFGTQKNDEDYSYVETWK